MVGTHKTFMWINRLSFSIAVLLIGRGMSRGSDRQIDVKSLIADKVAAHVSEEVFVSDRRTHVARRHAEFQSSSGTMGGVRD